MAPKRKAVDTEEVVAEPREARPSRAAKAVRTDNDDKPTKEKTTRTRSKKEVRAIFPLALAFKGFSHGT